MGPGLPHGLIRGGQPGRGFLDGFRAGTGQQQLQLCLGGPLLQLRLYEQLLGIVELGFGNFLARPQRPQSLDIGGSALDRRLGLLNGDFQPLAIFGPRRGHEQVVGRLQRRSLGLGSPQIGPGHRRIELNDNVPAMHKVAQACPDFRNLARNRRGQRHQPVRQCLGAADAGHGDFNRFDRRRNRTNHDRGFGSLVLGGRFRLGALLARRCAERRGSPARSAAAPGRQSKSTWQAAGNAARGFGFGECSCETQSSLQIG